MQIGWRRFSDPDFAFEFDYPALTEAGQAVGVERAPHPGGDHVHLSTPDARTVYFELSRTEGRAGDDEIHFLSRDVLSRFDDAWFSTTRQTELCGISAGYGWFRFADRVRWVIATIEPVPGYRVIVDPRSSMNLQILGSMTLRSK
ncbi:MAG: hypothetical protein ABIP53_05275 [Candidatus Limnocylindrales bacterium]